MLSSWPRLACFQLPSLSASPTHYFLLPSHLNPIGKAKGKPQVSTSAKNGSFSTSRAREKDEDSVSRDKKRPRTSSSALTIESPSNNSNVSHSLATGPWTDSSASIRDSITEMLGGTRWMSQRIVDGTPLTSRSEPRLRTLRRAITLAHELPESKNEEKNGNLPKIVVKILAAVFRQRLDHHEKSGEAVTGGKAQHLRHIGLTDLENLVNWLGQKTAGEAPLQSNLETLFLSDFCCSLTLASSHFLFASILLSSITDPSKALPQDCSEEEASDQESDSGSANSDGPPELAKGAQSISNKLSQLWRNDAWISQAPLPGLAPISVSNNLNNGRIRRMAELTKVNASEEIPDGLPNVVLKALRQVILAQTDELVGNTKHGWSQSKCIPLALELIEKGKITNSKPKDVDPDWSENRVLNKRSLFAVGQSNGKTNVSSPAQPKVTSSPAVKKEKKPDLSARSSVRNYPNPRHSHHTNGNRNSEEDSESSAQSHLELCRDAFNATSKEKGFSLGQELEILAKISELEVLLGRPGNKPKGVKGIA